MDKYEIWNYSYFDLRRVIHFSTVHFVLWMVVLTVEKEKPNVQVGFVFGAKDVRCILLFSQFGSKMKQLLQQMWLTENSFLVFHGPEREDRRCVNSIKIYIIMSWMQCNLFGDDLFCFPSAENSSIERRQCCLTQGIWTMGRLGQNVTKNHFPRKSDIW